jgi:hypothetical protein
VADVFTQGQYLASSYWTPQLAPCKQAFSVRLRNLARGGLGPIWAVSAIGWMDYYIIFSEYIVPSVINEPHTLEIMGVCKNELKCRIRGSNNGGYEEFYHLGYNAM